MKAVVFVDVQNDFVKGGKLAFGYPAESNTQKIVDFAKQCVADTDCKIYATRDTHEKTMFEDFGTIVKFDECGKVNRTEQINGKPTAGYLATLEGKKLPVEHCVEGTEGWQIVDELMEVLSGKCTFINKPTFGSYDLVDIMAEDFGTAPDEIILVGYCTSICVVSNALMLKAFYPNTEITIYEDLCGDITKESHEAALKTMASCQINIENYSLDGERTPCSSI